MVCDTLMLGLYRRLENRIARTLLMVVTHLSRQFTSPLIPV
jgi:hypothetical protein